MIDDFISLFFPHYCVGCKRPLSRREAFLCLQCDYEMPKTDSHLTTSNFIVNKFAGKLLLQDVLAYYTFSKGGRIQNVLHNLKYETQPELGVFLGQKYGLLLKEHRINEKYDLIVPVPLHKTRQKVRGYNQSERFAEGLSQSMEMDVDAISVKRMVKTRTQTNKSRLKRWENVHKIFDIARKENIENKRVLVVDDIVTTGATLESCVLELMEAGAAAVGIAVIAAAK